MKYYSICLHIEGRSCLVVGGGKVAERKARGLLDSGAKVTVVSPQLSPALHQLHGQGQIRWQARGYQSDDCVGHLLVMAATDDPGVQDMVHADAARHGILLNVADVPEKCSFILPALVKRGPLSLAISTGGNSPALAKSLQQDLEAWLPHEYGLLTEVLGLIRPHVLQRGLSQAENEHLFHALLHSQLVDLLRRRDWPGLGRSLQEHLGPDLPAGLLAELDALLGQK